MSHAVTVPLALDVWPTIVSPEEKAVARVISVGLASLIFLISNILTGTVAVGAVVNPVPNEATSMPEIDPIPELEYPRKVALDPRAVTVVSVVFALLFVPVITWPCAKLPVVFEIAIFPGTSVVIIPVTAGDASLEIDSPAINVPEVLNEDALKNKLLVAGKIVGITS